MELRGACVVLGLLLLLNVSVQQKPTKRKPLKKAETKDKAIEALQKQINTIVQEMKLVKQQQALQTACLKGIKVLNKCFLVDSAKKSYHAASEDCNSKGGVLVTPVSSSENSHLLDYIRQSLRWEDEVWLGINDMITEGDWVDQTGTKITYKNWAPIVLTGPAGIPSGRSRQPDGDEYENCAVLSTGFSGKWFDENCKEEKASVCQFNIV